VTGQVHDQVLYREEAYDLVGFDGEPLFDPEAYGFHPVWSSTACWRGYVCRYAVARDVFVLDRLAINHAEGEEDATTPPPAPPSLNGKRATRPRRAFFEYEYRKLGLRVPFTGRLLLGSGFIEDLYVHAGLQSAWKYSRIREAVLDEGRVKSVKARTDFMAKVRRHILGRSRLGAESEVLRWAEQYLCVDAPI